jgi:hypothetical protein
MSVRRKNRPRMQHIVPQMHLGSFANAAGQVCIYQKGKVPRWSAVSKTAVERDYHEFSVGTTRSDYNIEDTLANLESRAAGVKKKILTRSRPSKDEVATWGLFVAALFLRSRKVRAQISSRASETAAQFHEVGELRQLQYELLKRGDLVPLAEVEHQVGKSLEKILGSPAFLHLSGFHTSVPKLAYSICQKAWHTLEPSGGSRFVTSDCPVFTGQIRDQRLYLGHGFGLPDTIVFFAVSPQHLFVAAPPVSKWTAVLSPADVSLLNTSAIRFADREVYAHEESADLQRALDEHLNQITYGKDAYIAAQDQSS